MVEPNALRNSPCELEMHLLQRICEQGSITESEEKA